MLIKKNTLLSFIYNWNNDNLFFFFNEPIMFEILTSGPALNAASSMSVTHQKRINL